MSGGNCIEQPPSLPRWGLLEAIGREEVLGGGGGGVVSLPGEEGLHEMREEEKFAMHSHLQKNPPFFRILK